MSGAAATEEATNNDEDKDEVYEVEGILDCRRDEENEPEYRVRWKNYGEEWDTWEPPDNLIQCQRLLDEYHAEYPMPPPYNPGSDAPKSVSSIPGIEDEDDEDDEQEGAEDEATKIKEIKEMLMKSQPGDTSDSETAMLRQHVERSLDIGKPGSNASSKGSKKAKTTTKSTTASAGSSTKGGCGGSGTGSASSKRAGSSASKKSTTREGNQSRLSESSSASSTAQLRDPFWKQLEKGRVDLSENLYDRVGKRAAAAKQQQQRTTSASSKDSPSSLSGKRKTVQTAKRPQKGQGKRTAQKKKSTTSDDGGDEEMVDVESGDDDSVEDSAAPPPKATRTRNTSVTSPVKKAGGKKIGKAVEGNVQKASTGKSVNSDSKTSRKTETSADALQSQERKTEEIAKNVAEVEKKDAVSKTKEVVKPAAAVPQAVDAVVASTSTGNATTTLTPTTAPTSVTEQRADTEKSKRRDYGLPIPIDTTTNINDYFKWEMREYQKEKGRPLTNSEFYKACISGNLSAVRCALLADRHTKQLDIEQADAYGRTILIAMVERACDPAHESDDVLELLVQHGAQPNHRNQAGDTPLIIAAGKGFLCKVSKLLSLGAAANLSNLPAGETPLSIAAGKGFAHVVFRLLEYGADFNAVSTNGQCPLDVAVVNKHSACVDLLQSHVKKVKMVFERELQNVLGGCGRLKRSLFQMHCYALNESSQFRVIFPFSPFMLPQRDNYGFILFIGCAKFAAQMVHVRFWGTCPVVSVTLNDKALKPLQEDGRFIFSFWPLQEGINDLRIHCQHVKNSQIKLLIQAFFVELRNYNVEEWMQRKRELYMAALAKSADASQTASDEVAAATPLT